MIRVVPWEAFMYKIRRYFSTLELIKGFFIALLSSAFIYLSYLGLSHPLVNSFLGLLSLYLLLGTNTKTWFIAGAFIGLFWFWWISLSFIHYEMPWAIPLVLIFIMFTYGVFFSFIAWLSYKIPKLLGLKSSLFTLILKVLGLLGLSIIQPFGFDWLKPELMFVESYFGIKKVQFSLILLGIALSLWRKHLPYLLITLLALAPITSFVGNTGSNISLITTHTSVQDKWDKSKHPAQFHAILNTIDKAIDENKSLVILPESVFPIFLNRSSELMEALEEKAKHISIVLGALYWDGETPRNSTYIFTDGKLRIANKVILVPFGEANPLPNFLSNWVNKIFYDNAIDYKASTEVSDYTIDGISYRNAICFEATSEKLYTGHPKQMIVLSNNGWFTPSTQPTLQRLLLQYYSRKYGTSIHHSVNMSKSYTIQNGKLLKGLPKDGKMNF